MIKVDLPHEPLLIEFIHLQAPEEELRRRGCIKGHTLNRPEDPPPRRFTRCVIGPASCTEELKILLTSWTPHLPGDEPGVVPGHPGYRIPMIGWGVSVCHEMDEWNRGKARRYALASALKNVSPHFSKVERREIWDAYFAATTDKTLRT